MGALDSGAAVKRHSIYSVSCLSTATSYLTEEQVGGLVYKTGNANSTAAAADCAETTCRFIGLPEPTLITLVYLQLPQAGDEAG